MGLEVAWHAAIRQLLGDQKVSQNLSMPRPRKPYQSGGGEKWRGKEEEN